MNGQETQLARYLDGLQSRDQSPLAGVRGTHFARWVVIDDVVYEGPDQGEREHLEHARLLFTSNFDGALRPLPRRRCAPAWATAPTRSGATASAIRAVGGRAAFADYMRHHQIDSSLFFAAYGDRR